MDKTIDLGSILGASSDDNVLQTRYASLFITEDEAEQTVKIDPSDWDKTGGVKEVNIQRANPVTNFELYYTNFAHDGAEIHEIHNALRTRCTEESELKTRISSPGGSVSEGIQLISLAKENFSGRWTTILEAEASSMGAMTFACGDVRIAYEHSFFMAHDVSFGYSANGGRIQDVADHMTKWWGSFFRKTLVDTGMLYEEELQRIIDGKEVFMVCEEMVLRGIATHIIVGEYCLNGEAYLEYVDYGVPIAEYIEMVEAEDQGTEIVIETEEDLQKVFAQLLSEEEEEVEDGE